MNQQIYPISSKSNILTCSVSEVSNYDKGREFEIFVEKLFNQKSGRFIRVHHNSKSALIYNPRAASATFPDLKFIFSTKNYKLRFAVECKWRQSFNNGKIRWAEAYQAENYLNFQQAYGIPVFVAIGIGGLPSEPDRLFVTSLDYIGNKIHLSEKDLIPYNRNKHHRFFYDYRQIKLF